MIKLTPAEIGAKRVQLATQKAEAIAQKAKNSYYVSPETLVSKQTANLQSTIKIIEEGTKKERSGALLEGVIISVADQAQKAGESIIKGVKKLQEKLGSGTQEFKAKKVTRAAIQKEIAGLKAKQVEIQKEFEARSLSTTQDNARIEADNQVFAVKNDEILCKQHSRLEYCLNISQELKNIEARKESIRMQIESLDLELARLNDVTVDKKDELHFGLQGVWPNGL